MSVGVSKIPCRIFICSLIPHPVCRTRGWRNGQEHGSSLSRRSKRFLVSGEFAPLGVNTALSLSRFCRERTATNLVNAGAISIADLRLPEYAALLTAAQKVGVQYGDHMTRAMPRAEAEEIAVRILAPSVSSLIPQSHHYLGLYS